MAHIVIDARESGTSTGRYIDKLITYLAMLPSDHHFSILTKPNRVEYLRSISPNFDVVETHYREFSFGEQVGFKRQIDSLRPDLVHFGMVQQPVLYRGRVVTTMHDLTTTRFKNPAKNPIIFTGKQLVYKWLNRRVARKSSAIITPSEFVKQDVVQYSGVRPDKITVTYEAADKIGDVAEPVTDVAGKQFILYVGRPQPHKNLDRLIEAFVMAHKSFPQLHLVLAGKTDTLFEQKANIVKNRNLQNIIFTGFVSESQLRWLYEHCAAYVFPSLSEGFGLPGLEAMAHGAPVLSSKATCLPEIYGDAALYFDPANVPDITRAITEVLSSSSTRQQLVQAGHKQAARYSWQRMAKQTLEVYESVLLS